MKIQNTIWFTGAQGIVGIVLGYDEHTGDPKAYIGLGQARSADFDTMVIAQMGVPLLPGVAETIFKHFNPPKPKG